jgi:hypothetical protein
MDEEGHGPETLESEALEPTIPEPQGAVGEPEEELAEPKPDRIEEPRRLRRFLIWTVGLLVLFALGVVAAWFLQIQPMREQNRILTADLAEAQQSVESLSDEVERLRPLEAENQALAEQVAQLESHIFLLDVLVDVSKAQLELADEDPVAAKDALQGTAKRLKQLEERLSGSDADEVRDMSERLALALREVEADDFAARRDLEILANNLIALEQSIFGE